MSALKKKMVLLTNSSVPDTRKIEILYEDTTQHKNEKKTRLSRHKRREREGKRERDGGREREMLPSREPSRYANTHRERGDEIVGEG